MLQGSHVVATPTLDAPHAARSSSKAGDSPSEIELARKHIDAYNRRDLRALRALLHPDVELDWSAASWVGAGMYRGIDAVLGFYGEYFGAFEQIIIEPQRLMLAGDAVVVPNVARMRGRDGIEVSARSTVAFTVRRDRVTRICLRQ